MTKNLSFPKYKGGSHVAQDLKIFSSKFVLKCTNENVQTRNFIITSDTLYQVYEREFFNAVLIYV